MRTTEYEGMRVLACVANPPELSDPQYRHQTLQPVKVEEEVERIKAAFKTIHVDVIASEPGKAGTASLENLTTGLRTGYDILYLVCHGTLSRQQNRGQQTYCPFLWLDERAASSAISGDDFIKKLQALDSVPRLIVLASCESSGTGGPPRNDDNGALSALGPQLAMLGVPAVIAMQGNITMATVEQMMPLFFTELQKDGQIDRAFAVARSRVSDRADAWVPTLFLGIDDGALWGEEAKVWQRMCQTSESTVQFFGKKFKYSHNEYYVPRQIETSFSSFLNSKASAMAIVGKSGMGKTTLIARLLQESATNSYLTAFIESSDFRSKAEDLEQYITHTLQGDLSLETRRFWSILNAECLHRSTYVIVFIDAVNEYNPERRGEQTPVDLLKQINALAAFAAEKYPRLKYVITCRPETWQRATLVCANDFARDSSAYFAGPRGLAHELSRFSEDEAQVAYENYRSQLALTTPYEQLQELTKYLFRDPFLLATAAKEYSGSAIPLELDTGAVFKSYYDSLGDVKDVIQLIVAEMFASDKDDEDQIQRIAITRDEYLQKRSPTLYDKLDMLREDSPGFQLKQRNLLQQWRPAVLDDSLIPADETVRIRFTYDRFTEYLLARSLRHRIDQRREKDASKTAAAIHIIQVNLVGAQSMPPVLEALRQTLLSLLDWVEDYAGLLRAVAAIDARGLSLVVSVLARIARIAPTQGSPSGFAVLRSLLATLEKHAEMKEASPQFPLIEATYRILTNDEYRLWLNDMVSRNDDSNEARQHLPLLYGYFLWGFRHGDRLTSARAIQYLFFLWRSDEYYIDGIAIARNIVAAVEPLSLRGLLDSKQRVLIPNVVGLLILLLAELDDRARSSTALEIARSFVRGMRLKRSGVWLLVRLFNLVLTTQLLQVLDGLHNPVSLATLRKFFKDDSKQRNSSDFERVLGFIDPPAKPAEMAPYVVELARSQNSWVLEMLVFALSTCYEKCNSDDARRECLGLIQELFASLPSCPNAEYCAALSLYHISYFGSHVTTKSIEAMGKMADHILKIRQGTFQLGGEIENFNIVGTYGRVLYRNKALVCEIDRRQKVRAELTFILDALQNAKADSEQVDASAYYLYICKNLGLLGVLIEPSQVLDAMSNILRDVGVPERMDQDGEQFPFPRSVAIETRKTVLQSLANIRVLYRQEVDKYLLEVIDSQDLYAEVAEKTSPEFDISTFYSWSFEHVMFKMLTTYFDDVGKDVIRAFRDGSRKRSAAACVRLIVARAVARFNKISE